MPYASLTDQRESQRRFHNRNPDSAASYQFKYRHKGYSLEQYEADLEGQGGCALCGAEEGTKRHNVDHDHRCCPQKRSCEACRRGLLCHTCNTALGKVEALGVERVLDYIGYMPR